MANILLPYCQGGAASITSVTDSAKSSTFASSKFQVADFTQMTIEVTTSSTAGTSPTLDIAVQKLLPDGTNWQAIAQFTQITGDGTRVMHLVSGGNLEEAAATSLSSGTLHSVPFGGWWRLNYVIGGTSPSFTIVTSIEALA